MRIRVRNIEGYQPGEVVDLPDNRALVYLDNGQAERVGNPVQGPHNRMLDTSREDSFSDRMVGPKRGRSIETGEE